MAEQLYLMSDVSEDVGKEGAGDPQSVAKFWVRQSGNVGEAAGLRDGPGLTARTKRRPRGVQRRERPRRPGAAFLPHQIGG